MTEVPWPHPIKRTLCGTSTKGASMATPDEIERRIAENDADRTARRSAAAKQVGELAQRRADLAEQLDDIERELGDVLAAASDVLDITELARFTDVPATDLTRWLEARKTTRTKRKKTTADAPAKSDTSRGSSTARTPRAGQTSARPEPATPRADTGDTPTHAAAS
jgi:hypothetical protein